MKFDSYKAQLAPWKQELFTNEFANMLTAECKIADICPWFVISIIEAESGFDNLAIDIEKTHFGLMQLSSLYQYDKMKKLGGSDFFDPIHNVKTGIAILKDLQDDIFKNSLRLINNNPFPYATETLLFMKYYIGDCAEEMFKKNEIPSYASGVIRRWQELIKLYGDKS